MEFVALLDYKLCPVVINLSNVESITWQKPQRSDKADEIADVFFISGSSQCFYGQQARKLMSILYPRSFNKDVLDTRTLR